jgi:hypothetical protein
MARRNGRRGKVTGGPTLEAAAGALFGLVPADLAMASIFPTLPPPVHWLGALLGAALGYGAGAMVAAYREARFPFGRAAAPGRRHAASKQLPVRVASGRRGGR